MIAATPSDPSAPAERGRWEDLTLSVEAVMRVALHLLAGGTFVTVAAFVALWGLPRLPADVGAFVGRALWQGGVFALVYAASAFVHEALHAAGMLVFARVPLRSIRFGMRLSEGVLYVHTGRPMTVRAYRGVLALPGVVQGVVPLVAGVALDSGWMAAYGLIMLASAAGDVAVLRLLRGLTPDRLVRDHPHDVGCQVWEREGERESGRVGEGKRGSATGAGLTPT